jgi:peptide/nickel transport system permease protein
MHGLAPRLAIAVVTSWAMIALLAPWLAPHDPLINFAPLLPPGSAGFPLGTDLLGRDILSRLIWGARPVVALSLTATLLACATGLVAGLAAGFLGGRLDTVMTFFSNALLAFPALVLYLVLVVALGPSWRNVVLAIAVGTTPAVFRIARDITASIAGRDYIAAAVAGGETLWHILLVDILPGAAPTLVTDACLRLGYSIMMVGALGFLGLGLPPPAPDWGGMVADGRALAFAFPHLIVFPCLAIASLVLALSIIADCITGVEQ